MKVDRMVVPQDPPLVVHVIHALGTGGLENGLVNIINRTPVGTYRHAIVCLTQAHEFKNRLNSDEVRIIELHKQPGKDFGIYRRMWRALRSLGPSIVHTRNLTALEMQLVAGLIPNVKRVHGEHGRDIYDLHGENKKYNLLRRAVKPLVHHYIAVSKDLRDWLVNTVSVRPGRVTQIYNGVDRFVFHPRTGDKRDLLPEGFLPENGMLLGTVGRLAEVKDHATLIEAFALLLMEQPRLRKSVRLLIVGDGSMYDAIRGRIARHNLEDLCWMAGERNDVPEMLRSMDVFVLPSLGEGISNTLLEAMATGLPVIATRVGGNTELVQEHGNGLLVPPGSARHLMQALNSTLEDSAKRKMMGEEGMRKIHETFDWDSTVAGYLKVYDEVLGRTSGS